MSRVDRLSQLQERDAPSNADGSRQSFLQNIRTFSIASPRGVAAIIDFGRAQALSISPIMAGTKSQISQSDDWAHWISNGGEKQVKTFSKLDDKGYHSIVPPGRIYD